MISPKNISSPLKRLIYTNSLAIPFIFFSIYAIFGLKHSGEEDSIFYWIVAAISSLAAYVFIFFSLLNRKIINLKELLLYAFPISIVFLFYSEWKLQGFGLSVDNLVCSVCYSCSLYRN